MIFNENPVKIEGIMNDSMFEYLNNDFNREFFIDENQSIEFRIEFIKVDKFSGNADFNIISTENLIKINSTDNIPDGTILIGNTVADFDDPTSAYLDLIGEHLLPDNKFHWLPDSVAWEIKYFIYKKKQ